MYSSHIVVFLGGLFMEGTSLNFTPYPNFPKLKSQVYLDLNLHDVVEIIFIWVEFPQWLFNKNMTYHKLPAGIQCMDTLPCMPGYFYSKIIDRQERGHECWTANTWTLFCLYHIHPSYKHPRLLWMLTTTISWLGLYDDSRMTLGL